MGKGSRVVNQHDAASRSKPKRQMTPYNVFFKEQRQAILMETGGNTGGFAALARTIASRWKTISPEERFACNMKAAQDKIRYQEEMALWSKAQKMQICAIEPVPFCDISESSKRSRDETTGESMVLGRCLSDTLRNISCTTVTSQNLSSGPRTLDLIEFVLKPMDLKASAAKRGRKQPEPHKMYKKRLNKTLPLLDLPSKRQKHAPVESYTPLDLRTVFDFKDQLADIDLPFLDNLSMQLGLDKEMGFCDY